MSGLPAYQIVVLEPYFGQPVIVLDTPGIYDLRYSRALNDIGLLAMTLPSTAVIRAAFTLDSFIEIYRADETGALRLEETYLTRLTHRFIEGDEEKFVVGGVSLNHLLARRIVDPRHDVLSTDGYSRKVGFAYQVMADYCSEQVGPAAGVGRTIPGLSITTVAVGTSISESLRFYNLFNEMQKMAQAGGVDFRIVRGVGTAMDLQIGVVGADKTYTTNTPLLLPWVGLNPKRGNLTGPSLQIDRKQEGNYVFAMGQGEAEDRLILELAAATITDSPYNRIEFVQDLRNVNLADTVGLTTGAQAALAEKQVIAEFSYEPTGQEPGNVYRLDWDLGDAVTVEWEEFSRDLRITNVELRISRRGESISVTVSDDFTFPV